MAYRITRTRPLDQVALCYTALEKQYLDAKKANDPNDQQQAETLTTLKAVLERRDTSSWKDANLADQLLVTLHPEATLDTEIDRRLVQAEKMLDAKAVESYRKAPRDNATQKRPLLSSLLTDLQWAYGVRALRRDYMRRAVLTGSRIFIAAFAAFLAVPLCEPLLYKYYNTEYLLFYALVSGTLGASYSTLTSVKKFEDNIPLEKYETLSSFWYILSRILIGLCAALVLYYLIRAGLVQGDLLPNFLRDNEPRFWDKNQSLIIIYSFLAGFSEKLVPNLLSKMGTKMEGGKEAGKGG